MNILKFFSKRKKEKDFTYKYYCLLDINTSGLLVIRKNFQCMNFLKEYTLDTTLVGLFSSNFFEEKFFSRLETSSDCYRFRWDSSKNLFVKNKNITNLLQEKSFLASTKYDLLEDISSRIISFRGRVKKTLPYQETIYLTKKHQAERFKDRGYPESELLEYPYVLQYADLKKISLKQAADTILLKSSIDDGMLAKTELLRLKYFNKVRESSSKEELENTHKEFLLDFNIKI